MGASPREHRHSPGFARVMVVATMGLATLGVSCAERDPEAGTDGSAVVGGWTDDHESALVRLEVAIDQILSAVEGNDVRLLGSGPERCAQEAGSLSEVAAEAGATIDGARLDHVAALCEWLTGPAQARDVDGVVRTLDPLFTAVGKIAPLLDRPDTVS
ncbi:MAG: hypothetical protein HY828_11595 [Actinobacteria bacterium]|nr:hypothetical protein [Actinomycetota bacterium]